MKLWAIFFWIWICTESQIHSAYSLNQFLLLWLWYFSVYLSPLFVRKSVLLSQAWELGGIQGEMKECLFHVLLNYLSKQEGAWYEGILSSLNVCGDPILGKRLFWLPISHYFKTPFQYQIKNGYKLDDLEDPFCGSHYSHWTLHTYPLSPCIRPTLGFRCCWGKQALLPLNYLTLTVLGRRNLLSTCEVHARLSSGMQ